MLKNLLRRVVWTLAIVSLLVGTGYVFRAPLLTDLADAWVVNDPVTKADAIVIPGGGLENRPFVAAKLFHDGVAPMVLYTNVRPGPAEKKGVVPSEPVLTQRILLSNGVPATAMTLIGTNVANTFDESLAVRAWIEKTGAGSVIIVTDWFHTRRARWIFQRELRDNNVRIEMSAAPAPDYNLTNWWRHEEGVVAFQNEVVKYIYYRCEY